MFRKLDKEVSSKEPCHDGITSKLFSDSSNASTQSVISLGQPGTSPLGARGGRGKEHQLKVMKGATILLEIYAQYMQERAAKYGGNPMPWPIDKSNEDFRRGAYWVAQWIKEVAAIAESGKYKKLGRLPENVDSPAEWIYGSFHQEKFSY